MFFVFLSSFFLQHLDKGIQWQVPFSIQATGLSPSGTSVFLSGEILYLYTSKGTLVHEFTISKEARNIWLDNQNQIWVIFDHKLEVFSSNGTLLSKEPITTLIAPPITLNSSLGLVSTNGLSFYTLTNRGSENMVEGQLRKVELSFERTFSASPAKNRIFLSDQRGRVVLWYPFDNISYPFTTKKSSQVQFISESPRGSLALVFNDQTIQVRSKSKPKKGEQKSTGDLSEFAAPNPTYKKFWERQYPLEIGQKPIWLSFDQKECLVFLSEDRVMRVFQENGLEINRKLISFRPKSLIQIDSTRCLASFEQSKELVFYDFATNKFAFEKLKDPVIDLVKNGYFLLLVNREGHIKIRKIRQKNQDPTAN